MSICALLSTLIGALLVYLAHPQQRLLRAAIPMLGGGAGGIVLLAGTLAWCQASGAGAGVAAALTTLMFAWVLLPYVAWWSGRHAMPAKAGKR